MKIAIIDSSFLIYKTYFAFKDKQLSIVKDGQTLITSPIFGFMRELIKLSSTHHYEFFITVWDKAPYIKANIYQGYKEKRKENNNTPILENERVLIKSILSDMNIPILSCSGYEGEEIAAAVISKLPNHNLSFYTNDEDCYALLGKNISLINSVYDKNIKQFNLREFSEKDLMEKYGVTPKQFKQLKILTGCKSDNVPGIHGIGPVKASTLIKRFDTVNNILKNLNSIEKEKPKIANLISAALANGVLSLSKKLTKIEIPKIINCFVMENNLAYSQILSYIEAETLLGGNNKLVLKTIKSRQISNLKEINHKIKWTNKSYF